MSDKSLIDRWNSLMKVAPDEEKAYKKSWSENSKDLLTTEKKIYAIKINDGEIKPTYDCVNNRRNKKKTKALLLKTWLAKCEWSLPVSLILISFVQVFFLLFEPKDLTYQTLAFSPIRKCEVWRYLTYAFLHAGTAHLVINVILQLVIALPLESEVGHFNILLVYIGGIISGSLASVSLDFSLMVGASSGIYSLLMSYIPHIYMNFSSISHRAHRIIFVAVLTTSDVVYSLIHCLENREPQIAIGSHIAGALSGVLLGFIFYQNHRQENRDKGLKLKILKWTSIVCLLCLTALAVALNFL